MIQGLGRLLGKSAVVTGAAFGIGRATAELFAREGARLTATDIQGEPLLALADEVRRGGAEVETVIGDVSIEADARRMIQAAVDRFGRLDVLVANAGIIPLGDVLELTAADWDRGDGRRWARHVPNLQVRDRGDAADRRRRHRLPLLDLRGGRAEAAVDLRPGQVRRHRHHQAPGDRVGRPRDPGQRGRPRHDPHRAGQAVAGGAGRRRSTSPRSSECTRWAGSANRPKSPVPYSFSPPTTPRSSPAPSCRSMGDTWRNSTCNTYERPREGVRTHPIRLGRSQDRAGGVGVSAFRHGSGTPSAGSARTPRRSGGGDGGEGGLDGVADRHRREYTAVKINPCTTRWRPSSASV